VTQSQALAEAQRLKAIMNRWGLACSIELQAGRGSDPWAVPAKYLRMWHHTVSRYVAGGNMTPVLSIVKNGRPDVVGPLANGYLGYDLVYRIICMGLANHPGAGGPITIDGVHVPRDSARGPTWGTEVEGGIQPYEQIPGMLEAMGRADCALAEWSGRPLTSQLEHLTWAPTRKVDRLHFTRERGIALSQQFAQPEDDMYEQADRERDVRIEKMLHQRYFAGTESALYDTFLRSQHADNNTEWIKARVADLLKLVGDIDFDVDVDEQSIAAAILTALDPTQIAALVAEAVGPQLASSVAAELAARLAA